MTHDTNIPHGYKATALGIIPQEWEVKTLGNIAEINPSKGKITSKVVTFLAMSDISEQGGVINENILPIDSIKPGLTPFRKGDVIIAKITPCFENGKGALLDKITKDDGFGSTEFHVIRCQQDNKFVYYHTQSYAFRKRLESQMTGSAGQKRVPADSVAAYKIAVPPLAEQRKIAEVLGVWDEAIEKQARLIEKLALRKRALMQRLLSAKLRLPGFSEPWEKVKLGDVASIKTGNKNNEDKIANGQYPFFVRSSIVERINTYSYDGEAILIPGEGKIGEIIHYINGKFDYHQRVYKISDFSNCSGLFLYYYLMYFFGKQAINNSVKACVDSLRLSTFTNMTIIHPPISEQTAIAEVLTAADREIELAKEKLERLRRQKRGLMQQLLTGKKRVKYGN